MKKVLIISSSTGSGHTRAAEALKEQAAISLPHVEIAHIDMLEYVSLPMKEVTKKGYSLLTKKAPEIYRFLYNQLDKPTAKDVWRQFSDQIKKINASQLIAHIEQFDPDYIVVTHILPAEVLGFLTRQNKLIIPFGIVLTDYDIHELWIVPEAAHFFVATEEMKTSIEEKGIDAETIFHTGIPISPKFYSVESNNTLREKYGYNLDDPLVLLMAGGEGLINTADIAQELSSSTSPLTIIAIAGSNTGLKDALDNVQMPPHITYTALGWIDNVEEYMTMADVVITKPGGLTTSECLALGKPMIAVSAIPGQEECNLEFIEKKQLGIALQSPAELQKTLEEALLLDPRRYPHPDQPRAAEAILQEIKKALS